MIGDGQTILMHVEVMAKYLAPNSAQQVHGVGQLKLVGSWLLSFSSSLYVGHEFHLNKNPENNLSLPRHVIHLPRNEYAY
jgi:hypothetical protein